MRTKIVLVAVFAALTLALAGGPSYAGPPVDRFTYSDSETFTECDGAYEGVSTFSGMVIITDTNPSLDGQFFRFSDHYEFTDVITNPDTGDFVVISANGVVKELQPRSQDGRVFTYITHDTGMFTIRDSSGNLVIREAGLIETAFEFDTLGDGVPGGELLGEELVRTSGPHATFDENFDFCGLLDELIGTPEGN